MTCYLIQTETTNPHINLAVEQALSERVGKDEIILYLWQNRNTVVIGKHQNPWVECRVEQLQKDGGTLARRTSGGGAVFHDLGNLNFTFIVDRERYDLSRQLSVVLQAVRSLGIPAEFTGRNDLTVEGKKFSGNAFCFTQTAGVHHGTLLMNVDMAALGQYLQVDPGKMKSKGIASVSSRVTNLTQYGQDMTLEGLKQALIAAFEQEYGSVQRVLAVEDLGDIDTAAQRFGSWQWLFGMTPKFDTEYSTRFAWGGMTLTVRVKDGRIDDCAVWSDAMDPAFIEQVSACLLGQPFSSGAMADAVGALPFEQAADTAGWLRALL